MKKILSILLVAVLLVGVLPLTALAARKDTTIVTLGDSSNVLDDRQVLDFGHRVIGDREDALKIPIVIGNGGFLDAAGNPVLDVQQLTEKALDNMKLVVELQGKDFTDIFSARIEKHHFAAPGGPAFYITGKNIGTVDGVFYLVMLEDDGVTEVARSMSYEIHGEFIDPTINKHIVAIRGQNMATDARYVAHNGVKIFDEKAGAGTDLGDPNYLLGYLSSLNIQPGDRLEFSLHTKHFLWDPAIDIRSTVRKSTLDNDQVNAIRRIVAGNDIVKSVDFENIAGESVAFIVEFKEDWPQTKDKDFEMKLMLGIRGTGNEDSSVTIAGTFGNPIYYADQDNDYIYIGDGTVVEAERSLRNVELDLDNGVTIFANLSQNKRYYGKSSNTITQDDRDIMNFFPSIRKTVGLKTTNIEKAARYVTMKEEEKFFVYDADGKYVGMANEKLPYRSKYYLSTKELAVEKDLLVTTGIESDGEMDSVHLNPPTGGFTPNQVIQLAFLTLGLTIATGALFDKKRNHKNTER